MSRLLHLVASPRPESCSTRVAKAFLDSYQRAKPDDRIETFDLFQAEIPKFDAPQAKAKYAVMAGQTPRDEAEFAWQSVLKMIDHFKAFDKYVVSCPMWNFGVPYRLKQYLDVIVQPSLTVAYSPTRGYTGLVVGKPLLLVQASGGNYALGNPLQTIDFLESYLRTIFGFIGFTDVRSIRIQGTMQNPPEQVEIDIRKALAEAANAAKAFAG